MPDFQTRACSSSRPTASRNGSCSARARSCRSGAPRSCSPRSKRDPIQATVHDDPGKTIRPDLTIDEANADDFDALILPGGVRNPDQLRMHGNVIALIAPVRRAGQADRRDLSRPVAAGRSRSAARPHRDQLALDPHRPQERRRESRRRAGGDRRQHRHQPQSRRRRSFHRRAHRPDRESSGSQGRSGNRASCRPNCLASILAYLPPPWTRHR